MQRYGTKFRLTEPCESSVRVFFDVIVQQSGDVEWIAVSRQAAVVGETLILEIDEDGRRRRIPVCVIESRPVIVDGDTRHRIRLHSGEFPPIPFEQQIRRG
jgi:hypothetical protein